MKKRCLNKQLAYSLGISLIILVVSCLGAGNPNSGDNKSSTSDNTGITEIRVPLKSGINIRKGPGTNYELDESGQLVKGEKIYVIEEKNGWIHFRVTPNNVGWSGWVKKDLTVLESQGVSSKTENDINTFIESGLLVKINPQLNEAYVNPAIWNGLPHDTKENIGRVLAFYCGKEKGTNLNWVDIKDSYSGKKLAKYSESWGFKTY
jgi:SH3-like domain-containing protein